MYFLKKIRNKYSLNYPIKRNKIILYLSNRKWRRINKIKIYLKIKNEILKFIS